MARNEEKTERNEEMIRLRVEEGWTLQAIGNKFDVSRECVRQIVGATSQLARDAKYHSLVAVIQEYPEHMTVKAVAEAAGCPHITAAKILNEIGRDKEARSIAQFWQKVDTSGDCWEWLAYKHPVLGYGVFRTTLDVYAGSGGYAHRASWVLEYGEIPEDLHVLHACDNPGCVNPAHLFLGTHQDNMADRNSKMRQAHGERSGLSVLTEDDVLYLRRKLDEGTIDYGKEAARFGVNYHTIYCAASGRSWKHLDA